MTSGCLRPAEGRVAWLAGFPSLSSKMCKDFGLDLAAIEPVMRCHDFVGKIREASVCRSFKLGGIGTRRCSDVVATSPASKSLQFMYKPHALLDTWHRRSRMESRCEVLLHNRIASRP